MSWEPPTNWPHEARVFWEVNRDAWVELGCRCFNRPPERCELHSVRLTPPPMPQAHPV